MSNIFTLTSINRNPIYGSKSKTTEPPMKQIYPDLWMTESERPLPDEAPDLMMFAYLLVREHGNVLFCRSEHDADHQHIQDLGGMTHHYLTHWHEAAPGLARIRQRFGSKLVCQRLAGARISKFSP